MKKQLREWAEKFTPCYSTNPYQRGYSAGILDAKCTVLEILNQAELREVENFNIFRIYKENNVQMIKFLGYFYESDDGWKLVEFCWLDMPLADYFAGLSKNPDFMDEIESEAKQYITDFHSVFEAYEALKKYETKPLLKSELSEDTPEGMYY